MKVPSDIIRIYKSLHTWVGLIAGLGLFIAFYAGGFAVFKEPIRAWLQPTVPLRMVSLADAGRLVEAVLASKPSVAAGFTVHVTEQGGIPARLSWQAQTGEEAHGAGRLLVAGLAEEGGVQIQPLHGASLPDFIDTLHRVIGLPVDHDYARWVMGVVAVLYALALISGVVVLLPSLVKDFFRLRTGKNLKRMWLDAHNIVGIISLPFHLVMAITAVVFAYHDLFYLVQDQLSGKPPRPVQSAPHHAPPGPLAATLLTPQQLLERARQLAPDMQVDALQYQDIGGARPLVRVWGHDSRAVMPRPQGGFLVLQPYTGHLESKEMVPGAQSLSNTLISSFFALHMALFGGALLQWLYFLLAMAGAWLFFSGNLLWIESRRVKVAHGESSVPAQRREVRSMAALSVGISLGCMSGISLAMAASKLLNYFAPGVEWHLPLYYGVFLLSIAWALLRGAARASRDLLRFCALATLAIPISSLWVAAQRGYVAGWAVDVTALLASGVLAWLAGWVGRRLSASAADSVWHIAGR
ncbi:MULTISPECIES: PepSY domain-containing protein [unclassified Paludibacterium]|uniref:PepSY-associated TM helix domain-containing protein n=1 Tax=unclassified Paludibacterium TaxID=2618429 RepID=UPI001C058C43|nr:PepSY-associated TM helix domain-containing protein [Paludibacterium sp. B53371]BEV71803.1 PepSY-associated TM helix domain-containing protein [Paludibacterium sp. THUN1379]